MSDQAKVRLRVKWNEGEFMPLTINVRLVGVTIISALCLCAFAQQVTLPSTGHPALDQYRASRIAVYTDDFGQLARYREANANLKAAAAAESRVVFFGDSITDIWKLEEYFPGKPY